MNYSLCTVFTVKTAHNPDNHMVSKAIFKTKEQDEVFMNHYL